MCERHLDLDEWIRGERDWRNLFDLEFYLRRTVGSAYYAAIAEDEEIAEAFVNADGTVDLPDPPDNPPHFGWTSERSDLADIKDLLVNLVYVTAHSESRPTPTPRPKPALELVKDRVSKVRHSGFMQRLGFKN